MTEPAVKPSPAAPAPPSAAAAPAAPPRPRSIGSFLGDLVLNRNPEQLSFALMRLTGVALTVYLLLHVWTLSGILRGPQAFDESLEAYNLLLGGARGGEPTVWFALVEWLLLCCVLVHTFNGVRLVVADLAELTRRQRAMLAWAAVAAAAVGAVSLFWFVPGLGA